MDVTVKTLDGQNRSYNVPEDTKIREFKEKIAGDINITADTQRLIFQGRVLQDDKTLKDYDVKGKVIHVVHRPPPSSRPPGATGTTTPPTASTTGSRGQHGIVLGPFLAETIDPNEIQDMVQDTVMRNMGRNARVSTRASEDGHSLDVHIHLGQGNAAPQESESQLRINQARRMLRIASRNISTLEGENSREGNSEEENMDTDNQRPSSTSESSSQSQSSSQTASTATNQSQGSSQTASIATNLSQGTSQTASAATNQSQPSTQERQSGTDSVSQSESTPNSSGQGAPPGIVRPRISELGEMLDEVHQINRRFQPFLERFQRLLIDDPPMTQDEQRERQTMCNLVSETMHAISHSYHSLSDLMIDLNQERPRYLFAAVMSPPIQTAVIQQTIPVQIRVPGSPGNRRRNNGREQNPVSTASVQTSTTNPATNAESQTPVTSVQSTGTSTGPTFSSQEGGEGGAEEIVMYEMVPHSITRVSAEVVTSESESESTPPSASANTTVQSQPNPAISPDLIQSIVSSVVQAHVAASGGMAAAAPSGGRSYAQAVGVQTSTSQTSSGSTQTTQGPVNSSETQTTSASTITSGTQTRPRASPFIFQGGRGMPIPGMGLPHPHPRPGSMDPYLPCSSRHFFRLHANEGRAQESAPGEEFTGLMDGLLSTLLSQPNPHLHPQGSTASTTGASTTGTTTTGATSSTSTAQTACSTAASNTTTSQSSQAGATAGTAPPWMPFPGMFGPLPGMPRMPAGMPRMPPGMPGMPGMPPGMPRMPPGMPGMPGMPPGMPRMPPGMPGMAQMFGPMAQMFTSMMGGPGANQNPGATGGGNPQPTPSGQQGEPPFVQMLRGLLQASAQNPNAQSTSSTTGSTTGSNTGTTSTSSSSDPVMTDEMFTSIVGGISRAVSSTAMGVGPQESISTFLNNLGVSQQVIPGEGFINEVFSVASTYLTFTDLMHIYNGNPEPLDRLREPLQTFLRQRVLNGREPTMENIEDGVEKLVNDMQEELVTTSNVSEVKEDIDIIASWNSFFRSNLRDIIALIMRREQDAGFGQLLYERMRLALSHFIVLTRHCLSRGKPGLLDLIQNRLLYITSGVNPMIQQWMISITNQQLNQFMPRITATEEDIKMHIVKKKRKSPSKEEEEKKPEKSAKTSEKPSVSATKVTVSPGASTHQAMEVDNGPESSASTSVSTPAPASAAAMKTSGGARPKAQPLVNGNRVKGKKEAEPSGATGVDNSWEKEIPAEWVPVINGDIKKQKQNPPSQSPYSDAYLNGMPPKRRRLMTQDRAGNINNPSQAIPESIRRAVAAAGVEPISSMENLTNEATNDSDLQAAYEAQVSNVIQRRLESDGDYQAERFPYSSEYYQKNHNK